MTCCQILKTCVAVILALLLCASLTIRIWVEIQHRHDASARYVYKTYDVQQYSTEMIGCLLDDGNMVGTVEGRSCETTCSEHEYFGLHLEGCFCYKTLPKVMAIEWQECAAVPCIRNEKMMTCGLENHVTIHRIIKDKRTLRQEHEEEPRTLLQGIEMVANNFIGVAEVGLGFLIATLFGSFTFIKMALDRALSAAAPQPAVPPPQVIPLQPVQVAIPPQPVAQANVPDERKEREEIKKLRKENKTFKKSIEELKEILRTYEELRDIRQKQVAELTKQTDDMTAKVARYKEEVSLANLEKERAKKKMKGKLGEITEKNRRLTTLENQIISMGGKPDIPPKSRRMNGTH